MQNNIVIIQKAQYPHMTGGRKGGAHVEGKSAMINFIGINWKSEIPHTKEQMDFINDQILSKLDDNH